MIKNAVLLIAMLCASSVLAHTPASVAGQAGANKPVVLYGAAWCGYCTKAKAYLAAKKIQFVEVDVDTREGKNAFARATGSAPVADHQRVSGIPLLVMGELKRHGYSASLYDELFAK